MKCADISVIICAYTLDRWSDLVAAVCSVREETLAPSQLIAVIPQPSTTPKRVAARTQEG